MVPTNTIKTTWLQRLVLGYALLLPVCLILFEAHNGTPIFAVRFNAYAVIPLTCIVANLGFVFIVLHSRTQFKTEEANWYFLFLCTLILFGFCEMMQHLSATPHGALFWASLSGIGPAFESVGIFLFALLYVSPRPRNIMLMPVVILAGSILLFFHGHDGLLFQMSDKAIKLYPWGYNNDFGPAFSLNALWALGLPVLGIAMLLRFTRQTHNAILKRQAKLFALAISFPLAGALVFDTLAPSFSLRVPPLHTIFSVVTAGLLLYGLHHYRVFDVTPASLAGDILSTMSESVVVVNAQLNIELMNDSAVKVFGQPVTNLYGSSVLKLFDQSKSENIKQALAQVIVAGERYPVGIFSVNNQREKLYVRITAAKLTEEHGLLGYILAIVDVTELQKSYDDLQKAKNSVDRKVEARTKELRQAHVRLAETDKLKTEFVILTSHNLRTPLTTIKGYLEFLNNTDLSSEQKGFLTKLQAGTKRLDDLVEELLTISSIEAGRKSTLEPIKLQAVLKPVISEAVDLAKINKNNFVYDNKAGDVSLLGNTIRLQAAVRNLLDNGFKFTKAGTVRLEAAAETNIITLKVSDNGTGITADEMPKLFTKFHRGINKSALEYDYSGEGVGLYLTKLIIEEHGGTIKVVSQPGRGTTFTIVLPRLQS